MSLESTTSLYDSFNARYIESSDVPQTFVPPSAFKQVCQRNSTLIVGPRGSGKTTILKMLTPAALIHWPSDLSREYSAFIDYIGIFVPADSVWAKSKDLFLASIENPELRGKAQLWLFGQHIAAAYIESLSYLRTNISPEFLYIDRTTEAIISIELSRIFSLDAVNPSFLSLGLAIDHRVQGFFRKLGKITDEHQQFDEISIYDPIEMISSCIRTVNAVAGRREQKWALLFDEMEIVDPKLRNLIFSKLRSGEQRLLYKIAIAPYIEDLTAFSDVDSPAARDDFSVVELWSPERVEIEEFCSRVSYKLMLGAGIVDRSPFDLLGSSVFDDERDTKNNKNPSYIKNSRISNTFMRLYAKDKEFQEYVSANKLYVTDLKSVTGTSRAIALRKVRSLVVMRDEYLREDGSERSRRRVRAYSGATAVFAASEGNPRWLLSMLSPLIAEYKGNNRRISEERQFEAINSAMSFFEIKLYNMALPARVEGCSNVLEFVDRFGKFFRRQILGTDFIADPVLTFTVDDNVTQAIRDAIGTALKVGAFIYAEETAGEYLREGIAQKRLRVSYLLAPRYKLPFIKGKSRSVSFILQQYAKLQISESVPSLQDLWEAPDANY